MAGAVYATVSDILAAGHTLTAAQQTAAGNILPVASAELRLTARRYGHDIDAMIADTVTGADFALAVKSVIIDAVCRGIDAAESVQTVEQASETLGAYTYNYRYQNAGESLYFKKSELERLGLLRQTVSFQDLWGVLNG